MQLKYHLQELHGLCKNTLLPLTASSFEGGVKPVFGRFVTRNPGCLHFDTFWDVRSVPIFFQIGYLAEEARFLIHLDLVESTPDSAKLHWLTKARQILGLSNKGRQ